ncbi:uncharacterized protein LOC143026600 [Oratosquilla oratoria]|uniref:uncharacterized protein LOC143026600 n=1 Tax=Oratosquilla oratoria TaxID=337810 RepID=UPI003F768DB8
MTNLLNANNKGVEMVKQLASDRLGMTGNTNSHEKGQPKDLCQPRAKENNKKYKASMLKVTKGALWLIDGNRPGQARPENFHFQNCSNIPKVHRHYPLQFH